MAQEIRSDDDELAPEAASDDNELAQEIPSDDDQLAQQIPSDENTEDEIEDDQIDDQPRFIAYELGQIAATLPVDTLPVDTLPVDDGFQPLVDVSTSIAAPEGPFPENYARDVFASAGETTQVMGSKREWDVYGFAWEAPGLCHQPLYFQEVNLERYGFYHGHDRGLLQPVLSGAHFFAVIPALPYLATIDRPRDCIYTLGYYRPGSYAPYYYNTVPLRLDAAAVEAGLATGLIFLIP